MRRNRYSLLIVVAIGLLLLFRKKVWATMQVTMALKDLMFEYFVKFESFSAKPYWDVKRWSWGYGTRVPDSVDSKEVKPSGSIDKMSAFADSVAHFMRDYAFLSPKVTYPLTSRQWAAFLDFSYNLGAGKAVNLLENLNSESWALLKSQWLSYNRADDKVNSQLVTRRAYEWQEFAKDIKTVVA